MRMHINGLPVTLQQIDGWWVATVGAFALVKVTASSAFEAMREVAGLVDVPRPITA